MFGRNVFVLESIGFLLCFGKNGVETRADILLPDARDLREFFDCGFNLGEDGLSVGSDFAQHRAGHAFRLFKQGGQHMLRLDLLMMMAFSHGDSRFNRFLSLQCEFIQPHKTSLITITAADPAKPAAGVKLPESDCKLPLADASMQFFCSRHLSGLSAY